MDSNVAVEIPPSVGDAEGVETYVVGYDQADNFRWEAGDFWRSREPLGLSSTCRALAWFCHVSCIGGTSEEFVLRWLGYEVVTGKVDRFVSCLLLLPRE